MRHGRSVLAAVAALALSALAMTAPAASASSLSSPADPPSTPSAPTTFPARIDLPDGWQPEGITTDQESLYAGSLVNGAIWKADPRTGTGRVLWPGEEGSVAVGVDYDQRRDLLWVAGGPTGEVRAQDAGTGKVVATYTFKDAQFINDLTVTRRAVYATDSMRAVLLVVPLGPPDEELPATGVEQTVPLTGDYVHVPGEFNLNGIVYAPGRTLLAVQTVNGNLYSIERDTGAATLVTVEDADLTSGDGLERRGEVLYVVRNFLNEIVALGQTGATEDGAPTEYTRISTITDDGFAVPTTVASARGQLYAVNARLDITDPQPDTEYWITRVPGVH
jgi:hypothetical protein